MNIANTVISSTEEIFTSYVSLGATSGEPYSKVALYDDSMISAVVNFNGPLSGYIAGHVPQETARIITSAFLFLEDEDLQDSDLRDAIGEISNILAGRVKAFVDPNGSQVKLSLPEFSLGGKGFTGHMSGGTNLTIPFYMDDGCFMVDVHYKKAVLQ